LGEYKYIFTIRTDHIKNINIIFLIPKQIGTD